MVSTLTVVGRITGMLRDQVAAAILGGSVFNDAFLTAFTLPNLLRRLLGEGALTAAFIPTLQEEFRENGRAGAFALLSKVTSWLLLITTLIAAGAMLLFSQSRLISGQEGKWYLVADLTAIMFPYLALICVAAALNATLNVLDHFLEPALSPIWLNLSMILSLGGAGLHFAKTPMGEVHWLCGGVLAGGTLQMLVPAVVLVRLGWRPSFVFELAPRVRQIAALMAPGIFGTAIYQINLTVSRWLAYTLPESTATVMFYANRLMELPIGVFAVAVSTVVYPMLARHAAEKNSDALAGDFRKGIRLILLINLPAAAGLALLGHPIVRLLYQHGRFSEANAALMSQLLILSVIGLPFFSVVNLTVRAFYAVKDTKTPVRIAAFDFVLNLGLSVLLKHWFGAAGLVVASTVAIMAQTLLLQRALAHRIPGLHFSPLLPTLGKIAVATGAMAAIVTAGRAGVAQLALGRWADLIAVLVLIPLGVAIYALVLWRLKIEGREELAQLLTRLRGRFSRGTRGARPTAAEIPRL